jgi:hypothetical protein
MLAWLLVGHLAGDFLLQNRWMAENKSARLLPLLAHSAVYACAVWLASLPCGGLGVRGVLLVFASHVALDNRKFVTWWCERVTRCGATESASSGFLVFAADQAWHAVFLAVASALENKI